MELNLGFKNCPEWQIAAFLQLFELRLPKSCSLRTIEVSVRMYAMRLTIGLVGFVLYGSESDSSKYVRKEVFL